MSKKIHLLIIDPQNDFCDSNGSLYVQGAEGDMKVRLPEMIKRLSKKIDDIHVTLDSHRVLDVAHPGLWKNSSGENPDPFTIITSQDIQDGVYTPVIPSLYKEFLSYVKTLESGGRYPLCIWPEHCVIGTWGTQIVPELNEALRQWELDNFAMVDYVTKGSNFKTEHYSAVKAEVPDPSDPSTQLNTALINTLESDADEILVAGEALDYCLANSLRDIIDGFQDQSVVSKIVILEDATSPVGLDPQLAKDFISDMKSKGVRFSKTTEYLI